MGATVDRERIMDAVISLANRLNATPAQVALRWVMDQDGITSAIIGVRNLKQLNDNMGAADLEDGPGDLEGAGPGIAATADVSFGAGDDDAAAPPGAAELTRAQRG
jgi:aryl-alcohol dehydrogenase-like predicted oxidoreductase